MQQQNAKWGLGSDFLPPRVGVEPPKVNAAACDGEFRRWEFSPLDGHFRGSSNNPAMESFSQESPLLQGLSFLFNRDFANKRGISDFLGNF